MALKVGTFYIHQYNGEEQLVYCAEYDSDRKFPFKMEVIGLPYSFNKSLPKYL